MKVLIKKDDDDNQNLKYSNDAINFYLNKNFKENSFFSKKKTNVF